MWLASSNVVEKCLEGLKPGPLLAQEDGSPWGNKYFEAHMDHCCLVTGAPHKGAGETSHQKCMIDVWQEVLQLSDENITKLGCWHYKKTF